MSRSSRPSLKSYISVDGEDEYSNKICQASDDDGTDNEVFDINVEFRSVDQTVNIQNEPSTWDALKKKECCSKRRLYFLVLILSILTFASIIMTAVTMVTRYNCDKSSTKSQDNIIKSPEQVISPQKECLLYSEEGSYSSKSNPLKHRCTLGSGFVSRYCPRHASTHNCKMCRNEQLLPNFCFCDVGNHCNGSDAPRKLDCTWCQKYCPCLNNGVCKCNGIHQHKTGDDLSCSCPNGYKGKYCEIIPVRICKQVTSINSSLENCYDSLQEDCFMYSRSLKTNVTCTILKDKKFDDNIIDC